MRPDPQQQELSQQAEQMYAVLSELLRRYQFRDREQVCCHGLSISQCYTLELLADGAPQTMTALASQVCRKLSSMTRVVDALVASGFVERIIDPRDRRVCCVRITPAGSKVVSDIQADVIHEYARVLHGVPAASRAAVIDALTHLLDAFKCRHCGEATGAPQDDSCCGEPNLKQRRRTKPARPRSR